MAPTIKVACCHASPIYLNARETTAKCLSLVREAAQNGANLVIFPETYIPAFPFWSIVTSPAENHTFFRRMAAESVYVDGEEVTAIRHAAKELNITVSVGISEKVHYSSATLFNANLIIGTDGTILVHHRKLMPTFYEKLTWSQGDGYGLKVIDLEVQAAETEKSGIAKLGMLICGENTNPLARYSMIAQGEQIHISTWPAKSPMAPVVTEASSTGSQQLNPDNSLPESFGVYDNLAANRTRTAAHCFEGKCFGILCAGFMSRQMIDDLIAGAPPLSKATVTSTMELAPQAETMFLDPTGTAMPGYTINPESGKKEEKRSLRFEEGILYADLDVQKTVEGKQYHDIVGGYQRFDVFDLKVNTARQRPITLLPAI